MAGSAWREHRAFRLPRCSHTSQSDPSRSPSRKRARRLTTSSFPIINPGEFRGRAMASVYAGWPQDACAGVPDDSSPPAVTRSPTVTAYQLRRQKQVVVQARSAGGRGLFTSHRCHPEADGLASSRRPLERTRALALRQPRALWLDHSLRTGSDNHVRTEHRHVTFLLRGARRSGGRK